MPIPGGEPVPSLLALRCYRLSVFTPSAGSYQTETNTADKVNRPPAWEEWPTCTILMPGFWSSHALTLVSRSALVIVTEPNSFIFTASSLSRSIPSLDHLLVAHDSTAGYDPDWLQNSCRCWQRRAVS